jgi:hypothetical protein
MTHMFDLQYIKDDMIEKHVVKRKRSAARIYTCLQNVYGKGRVALSEFRKVSRYTYR